MATRRVIFCDVDLPASIQYVKCPFEAARKLIRTFGNERGTPTIEMIELDDGVNVFFDENSTAKFPLNRELPATMPHLPEASFVIDLSGGDHPAPGEMGVHRIHGPFVLTRMCAAHEDEYADLMDEDIEKYLGLLNQQLKGWR